MSGSLYILSGPSTCGKTTLLNNLCELPEDLNLRIIKAPKYSTREERKEKDKKDDVIQIFDERKIPNVRLGTGPFYNSLEEHIDVGSSGIDIAYALNQERYGISTSQIDELLSNGNNVFIILSDFRIIKRLKKRFLKNSFAVYIASAIDIKKAEAEQVRRIGITKEQSEKLAEEITKLKAASNLERWDRVAECIGDLNDFWMKFKPGADKTDSRTKRLRDFHKQYIDFITLFDHVILNYTEGSPIEMTAQMINIMQNTLKFSNFHKEKLLPPIFIMAAASGAGKGTMMQMLGLIGADRVKLVSKLATRDKKENDKADGMLAIGSPGKPPREWPEWPKWWTESMIAKAKSGYFPEQYDITWEFHTYHDTSRKTTNSVKYAISSKEINENLSSNTPQIFISNMHQFEMFREKFGNRVVFLYLYRLTSAKNTVDWYKEVNPDPNDAKARIEEIRSVHDCYIKQIAEFDHVILNTTHQEDLYDQIFQLIEYYHDYKPN